MGILTLHGTANKKTKSLVSSTEQVQEVFTVGWRQEKEGHLAIKINHPQKPHQSVKIYTFGTAHAAQCRYSLYHQSGSVHY